MNLARPRSGANESVGDQRTTDGPYLNSVQGAAYLGFDVTADPLRARRAFYEFARRYGVPKFHRGTVLLFRRIDLDRAVGNVPSLCDEIRAGAKVLEIASRIVMTRP